MSDLKISDPVLTLTLARGVEKGGLFELLDAALAGELVDLPAMRAHQRAAVVTVLALIAHTLRRRGGGKPRGRVEASDRRGRPSDRRPT